MLLKESGWELLSSYYLIYKINILNYMFTTFALRGGAFESTSTTFVSIVCQHEKVDT